MPELDARPMLTMADMGHGGMGHDMNAMSPQKPADAPAASQLRPIRTPVTVHQQNRPRLTLMRASDAPEAGCSDGTGSAGHTMPPQQPADPHAGHNMAAMSGGMQQHPSTEDGNPLVDMQTMMPTSRLDDPGIGLRDNGRRVLTYADLRRVRRPRRSRAGTDDRTASDRAHGPVRVVVQRRQVLRRRTLRLTYGERLRIVLVNDTMMTHPIHLHGMWSDIEDDEGKFHVRKHTVDMPPARNARIASLRMHWDVGRITATCSFTWKQACSGKCGWKNDSTATPPTCCSHRWSLLATGAPAFAQADSHAGHQQEQSKPNAQATEPAKKPGELPPFIPPVTDEARKAAFPDVEGHAVTTGQ